MTERSSLLFAKKAEPLFFVFLFVLLPFAATGLAGDGDDAGGQGLSPAGCWRALGAGGHFVFIRGDGRGFLKQPSLRLCRNPFLGYL